MIAHLDVEHSNKVTTGRTVQEHEILHADDTLKTIWPFALKYAPISLIFSRVQILLLEKYSARVPSVAGISIPTLVLTLHVSPL